MHVHESDISSSLALASGTPHFTSKTPAVERLPGKRLGSKELGVEIMLKSLNPSLVALKEKAPLGREVMRATSNIP